MTVATPTVMPVTLYAEFTGNTAPVSSVDLEARVQGFLESIGYRDGEAVRKGRVLFQIEKDQYQAQVDLQKAQLDSARAKQANAQREFDRQSTLGQREVSSQRSVDDARTNLDTANALVAASEANLKLAETSLAYATVQAPSDGVVTRHLVDVGALVGSSGPTKLATILQVDPIYVYFNLSEQQQIDLRDSLARQGKTLRSLREEEQTLPITVALSADTAVQYAGRIDYIAPQLDAATGTLQMRAVLENKQVNLVPGLFVRVRVPIGRIDEALLVDDTAVMSNQTGSYVMVVGSNNVVEQRPVTTGPVEGQLRVVTKGLAAGDRVVIGAVQRAVAGSTVTPVTGTMAAAPGATKPAPAASGSATSLDQTKP
ncbi:efflux RND transporter periplasmic adaptor subunit [Rhodoplanes sp. TEM]|uniref:Efflux RND transporter periplasmic adaptor subunit n=1 Tax=Rhodoplanes tepidamans TaxID=200616 RepID=A0ABT5JJ36_RHOTP|nr:MULTISPECIES: efflux RND transporter periplasmic adaptor subunit [Rhodoplanes]MDC7789020.1 efflux RND transporter periplasmic adaptor subunit [Rhodoplanes tepidamans]MDC7985542.1 efflux RND transporter periplasmic adaptor subunit [Rhodoplanes sp. TEM]MDQ0355270.1 membrane fusion protein (multidrug efflux system) [Rhodoplanes tepidamans]